MGLAYKVSSPNDFGFDPDFCHSEIHHYQQCFFTAPLDVGEWSAS